MAIVIFLFVAFLVVMAVNPAEEMAKANDQQRLHDVEDILQMMIELGVDQPEVFSSWVGQAANGRAMFGLDDSCAGSHGSQCSDEQLADTCLSTTFYTHPEESFPIDPLDEQFDVTKTGYYLDFVEGSLVIGACHPQAQESIELRIEL